MPCYTTEEHRNEVCESQTTGSSMGGDGRYSILPLRENRRVATLVGVSSEAGPYLPQQLSADHQDLEY